MRRSIVVTLALGIGFVSARISAQNREIEPLPEQIREVETALGRGTGKGDAKAWLKLAILRQNAARYLDSEHAYRRAIALLKAGDRATLASAMDSMGTMYAECGAFSKAERLERKALDIRERENDVVGIGRSHMHLSVVFFGKRKISAAEKEAAQAVRLLIPEDPVDAAPASPEDQMSALINLSMVRCARGACAGAIPQLRSALNIAHRNYAENSIPVGFINFLLGYAFWKSGDNESAGELMRTGTQELSTQLGWGHPMYVRAMKQYGTFLDQAGHSGEAEEVRARIAKFEISPGTIDVLSLMFK